MPADFIVNRSDLRQCRLAEAPELAPAAGEAVLAVERFALTANNITYGVAGDMIGYWQFFPAEQGWGRIPVWGIGRVTASQHDEVPEGERYYGYFPMSDALLVRPGKVAPHGFADGAAHRAELPPVYNQYARMTAEQGFEPHLDNHQMLYRPLFSTAFVLDDFLRDNDWFGAEAVILGSASSKTAFGTAFMLQRDKQREVVGLTSAGNRAFVESLNLYDQVLTYDQADQLAQRPSVFVDMAGSVAVRSAVHHRLAELLTYSCAVGVTHWQDSVVAGDRDLPGAKPTLFFAPTQMLKRNEELGPREYQRRVTSALGEFYAAVDSWVTIETFPFAEVETVYRTMLDGPAPNRGFIVASAP